MRHPQCDFPQCAIHWHIKRITDAFAIYHKFNSPSDLYELEYTFTTIEIA